MRQNGRTRTAAGLLAGGSIAARSRRACGGDDEFKNEPRPPVTTALTGVITDDEVTVSPDTLPLKAEEGQADAAPTDLYTPIALTISNQTDQPHTITLTGKPRNPKLPRSRSASRRSARRTPRRSSRRCRPAPTRSRPDPSRPSSRTSRSARRRSRSTRTARRPRTTCCCRSRGSAPVAAVTGGAAVSSHCCKPTEETS